MNTRFIDWIWHINGSLALAPEQSSDEAFGRLDPLFRQRGTSHERMNDTLTFRKKDQAAQDKMAVFESGVLQIEKGAGGPVLRYRLASRTLLFCFLLPLLFMGFAQLTIYMAQFEKPSTEAASKKPDKKDAALPQNPIDKFLGAPAPEKPKDGEDKPGRGGKKPSPTPAYVFAVMFTILYGIGRILEARKVKSLFQKSLLGAVPAASSPSRWRPSAAAGSPAQTYMG